MSRTTHYALDMNTVIYAGFILDKLLHFPTLGSSEVPCNHTKETGKHWMISKATEVLHSLTLASSDRHSAFIHVSEVQKK